MTGPLCVAFIDIAMYHEVAEHIFIVVIDNDGSGDDGDGDEGGDNHTCYSIWWCRSLVLVINAQIVDKLQRKEGRTRAKKVQVVGSIPENPSSDHRVPCLHRLRRLPLCHAGRGPLASQG